jgi:dihydrofolate reductase
MRKVIFFNFITLDGFFEGANKELDWHNVDAEFNEFATEQLLSADMLLFGRVTYELMASYWPTESGIKDDPTIAQKMNSIPKIVFSRTLKKAEWNNTKLVKENIEAEVEKLKQQAGKNIFVLGSADLSSTLIKSNLIDEYRIMINPLLLGKGTPLFKGMNEKLNLKLIKTKVFNSGNVLLFYEPLRKNTI